MVIIGLLYLLFEDFVLADFSRPKRKSVEERKASAAGRVLIGIQVSSPWSCINESLSS